MAFKKILVVRKMSALEYYYNGNHKSEVINESHKSHNESLRRIEEILKKAGTQVDIVTRKELSEELLRGYDAVISAGGDGTVIAVAAYNLDIIQLNLRTDSRSAGALCQKDVEKALELFLSGKYKIEEWQRQDVYLDGKFAGRASNETCVGERLRFDKLAKYNLMFLDAESGLTKQETQSGSGIVIVTGTGSSAWPAAFKTYSRSNPYFEFRTLLPYSGIIGQGKAGYVRIDYKGHEGKFSIDTKEFDLPRDSRLEIKLSKNPLRVITPN
ncbi:MAG: NAD(+)/NADH kinase [Nanoarchaeota archaeon]|nr:NAD(+)/NADH kinase [Nanoarchaeota archaeon]